MSDPTGPADKAQRCARILGELTELSLTLARDLHARALAAETWQEAQALALGFQRVSRGVRQSLALEVRLERELSGDVQATEAVQAAVRERREAQVHDRKRQVAAGVNQLIWHEPEIDLDDDEAGEVALEMAARLDEIAAAEDFLTTPVHAWVAHLAAELGLVEPDSEPEADLYPDPQAPCALLTDAGATGPAAAPNSS